MHRVPLRWADIQEWISKCANAINSVIDGHIATNAVITLGNGSATTVVTDRKFGIDSVILFQPMTANASAEVGAGTMHIKTTDYNPRGNQFTINHANNSQTDRTFRYIVLGQTLN
jgi:hypothetical protein